MRLLCLILLFAGVCACGTGVRRVGPPPTGESALDPVVLIVVDGLRQDVFANYLRTLAAETWEPNWKSGLSLLNKAGFEFANSSWAGAPFPPVAGAAFATIVTGQRPADSGIPGTAFHRREPQLVAYDFDAAPDASRVFFGPALSPLVEVADAAPHELLAQPTVFERMAPRRGVAINFPFAGGSDLRVPGDARQGTDAMLPHAVGAAAVPLLDRASRDAAVDVILTEPMPDLLALQFRRVAARSCHQADERCAGRAGELVAVQAAALKAVDAQLWRVLAKLQAAHPGKFSRTTFLLTSTGGMVDRPIDGGRAQLLAPDAVFERVAKAAAETCAAILTPELLAQSYVLAANSSTVFWTERPQPAGQRAPLKARRDCVADTLQRLVRAGEWAAAVSWRTAQGPQATVNPAFEQSIAIHRRRRARAKLKALVGGVPRHSPDIALVAQPGWLFVPPAGPTLVPAAGRGSLDDAVMRIPFLVASQRWTPTAKAAIPGTPIELTDVTPTILALLDAPPEAFKGLARAPLFRWRSKTNRVLDLQRADRQIAARSGPSGPQWIWQETADSITFGITESDKTWPPRELVLRVGDQRYVYDAAKQAFPEGLPCTRTLADDARTWTCTVPLPTTGETLFAGRRTPAGDEADDEPERNAAFMELVPAGGALRFTQAQFQCADEEGLKLRVDAADPTGLRDISLVVVDAYGGGRGAALPGSGHATHPLSPTLPDACTKDPTSADCAPSQPAVLVGEVLALPFPADAMRHAVTSVRLFTAHQKDRAALSAGWKTGTAPRDAYLAARVCNLSGACEQRPVVSDVDYLEALARACP